MYTIATDLTGGVLVGLFIGLSLDKWLGTKPLCLIVCIILGFIAGFRNIIRSKKDDPPQPPESV